VYLNFSREADMLIVMDMDTGRYECEPARGDSSEDARDVLRMLPPGEVDRGMACVPGLQWVATEKPSSRVCALAVWLS
jgi:hypothetical protein